MHSEFKLPFNPTAARIARRGLDQFDGRQEQHQIAELLLDELVTNALQHGQGPIDVALTLDDDDKLKAEVADRSLDRAVMGTPQPEATSGHGLVLVDRLATRWGVDYDRSGKRVWFELSAYGQGPIQHMAQRDRATARLLAGEVGACGNSCCRH